MKNLKVKWLPETFVIASLSIATSQTAPAMCGHSASGRSRAVITTAPARLIVISGEKELKADVRLRPGSPGVAQLLQQIRG